MLFNSFTFLGFLIIVLTVSRRIGSWTFRKFFLLICSYIFYAAWNPPFVILIWISTLVDWLLARKMGNEENPARRKFYLTVSVLLNLGLLSYFKYGNFLMENFMLLMQALHVPFKPQPMSIVLPAGISFYTFQTLSYIFDVYRKKTKPWPFLLDYALYVTFFPHLIAGPILRSENFLMQCQTPRKATKDQLGWGMVLLILGLFSKMFIADMLMMDVVEKVYDAASYPTFAEAWTATFAFGIQIFCDFSGYSTCAMGIALMLGFIFPENFRFPFAAAGFSDYWRRWHITFSSWLREYLYIPLGGNRKGPARTYANLMITMLLGGLWHGASWMFVIWGGLHGFYLIAERFLKGFSFARYDFWGSKLSQFFLMILTYLLVCLTWPFFRARHIGRAFIIFSSMFGRQTGLGDPWGIIRPETIGYVLAVTVIFFAAHYFLRDRSFRSFYEKIPWWAQGTLLGMMIFGIIISIASEDRAFIYFQF